MYEKKLSALVQSNKWLMDIVRTVRAINLPNGYVGAGVVRNLVWDHLHGYAEVTEVRDVDVAFFDPENLTAARDQEAQRLLHAQRPDVPWEATNQAAVHLWYEAAFGYSVPALGSSEEAIGTWPETATCVGIRLLLSEQLQIVAPHGLEDLFEMRLRRNPASVSMEQFQKRLLEKRILEKWPLVQVIAE